MKKYKITLRDRKNKKIDFFTEKLTFQEAVCVAYKERAHSKFEHTIVSVIEVQFEVGSQRITRWKVGNISLQKILEI